MRTQDNSTLIERARPANGTRQFEWAREDLAVVLARSPMVVSRVRPITVLGEQSANLGPGDYGIISETQRPG